jgi:hypothetical protein
MERRLLQYESMYRHSDISHSATWRMVSCRMEQLRMVSHCTCQFTSLVLKVAIKVNANLSLCLIKHDTMKTYNDGGLAPCILKFGARWRWRHISQYLLPVQLSLGLWWLCVPLENLWQTLIFWNSSASRIVCTALLAIWWAHIGPRLAYSVQHSIRLWIHE